MKEEFFRIHGDNILECERILNIIAEAIGSKVNYIDSRPYNPEYALKDNLDKKILHFKLFPGYNRFGVNIYNEFEKLGAPLREATDAIVTKPSKEGEDILFSVEFCNALPAGNNAWQRTGRSITSAFLNIPYFHISEIGGVELGEGRKLKAQRFPNPIIPFSYITLGKNYHSLVLPVYLPSPSISTEMRDKFKEVFNSEEYKKLIVGIIRGRYEKETIEKIIENNLRLVKLLSSGRKRGDTFKGKEWDEFFNFNSQKDRLLWLEKKKIDWKKKGSSKVKVNKSFLNLLSFSREFKTFSVGAGDIPICLISSIDRINFSEGLKKIYPKKLSEEFLRWVSKSNPPLIIVWVTGFKPKGDDSRPDRGLVPLARMLLGPEVDLLTIVSGPAKKNTWNIFKKDYHKLILQNGLWESILNLSDSLLVDSSTCDYSPIGVLLERKEENPVKEIMIPLSKDIQKFSEQDVDSVIHFLFTNSKMKNIFECMCNPPGGDWSGLSIRDFKKDVEYRWTSLPRVSKTEGKRPDHVIQFSKPNEEILFSIESKDSSTTFEDLIGIKLNRYTNDLVTSPVISIREKNNYWKIFNKKIEKKNFKFYSVGAFCYKEERELKKVLEEGKFDYVLGIEFKEKGKEIILHLISNVSENLFIKILEQIISPFKGLKIKIH